MIKIVADLSDSFQFSKLGHFFSIVYGIVNLRSLRCDFASAGHPPVFYFREDGTFESLGRTGDLGGLDEGQQYGIHTVHLRRGDRFLLFSDGAYEVEPVSPTNGFEGQLGLPGLSRICKSKMTRGQSLEESVDAVVREIFSWRGADQLEDDLSLLAVEVVPCWP